MNDPYRYPKLRWPIDVQHQSIDGRNVLILKCPIGISPKPLGLMAEVAPIIGTFEGNLDISEITKRFAHFGLKEELVVQLVKLLDEHLLLESPHFEIQNAKIRNDFKVSTTRQAALAGLSYPDNPKELAKTLDAYLANGSNAFTSPPSGISNLIGLVSPHIDYHRGGISYGIAWSALKHHEHDLYVIIGTSHQYSKVMFHLTCKDFESPLGTLKCNREFVGKIASNYGQERSFNDELLHRREHSLELQMPFLKHLKSSPKIAPILVGGFHHLLRSGKLPNDDSEYSSFIGGLTEALKEHIGSGQSFCLVAGVDMAHVGKQFGDSAPLSQQYMDEVAARDQSYLNAIIAQDKRALFAHIEEDGDKRRICGFPTMYTIMDAFDLLGIKYKCQLLDYRQAVDFNSECAVTFAGLSMTI